MNKAILIGVGGSGARSLSAVNTIAAAGQLPNVDEISLVIIDQDTGNPACEALQASQSRYQSIHASRMFEGGPFFHPRVLLSTPGGNAVAWPPNPLNHPLGQLLQIDAGHGTQDGALASVLFQEEELLLSMDDGFRGCNNIGTTTLLLAMQSEASWQKCLQNNGQATVTHVVIVASGFGGTGASSVTAVGEYVKKHFPGALLALVVLGPYFTFPSPDHGVLAATSDLFECRTQTALQHYAMRWKKSRLYHRIYLTSDVRNNWRRNETFALGRNQQQNRSHHAELLAAFATADFLQMSSATEEPAVYVSAPREGRRIGDKPAAGHGLNPTWVDATGRLNRNVHSIQDLPGLRGPSETCLRRFTAFCMVLTNLSTHHQVIGDVVRDGGYYLPWLLAFDAQQRQALATALGATQSGSDSDELRALISFSKQYTGWLGELHEAEAVQLFRAPYRDTRDGAKASEVAMQGRLGGVLGAPETACVGVDTLHKALNAVALGDQVRGGTTAARLVSLVMEGVQRLEQPQALVQH